MGASFRGNAPAGARTGHARGSVGGEEKARGAGGLRGKAEASGSKRRFNLQLGEAGGKGAAFQAFFQSPGALRGRVGFDNEKTCGVETGAQEAGTVRSAPFPAGAPGQAPQDKPATIRQGFGDHRQDEAETGGGVAVSVRLDLVEPALAQRFQGAVPVIVGGG